MGNKKYNGVTIIAALKHPHSHTYTCVDCVQVKLVAYLGEIVSSEPDLRHVKAVRIPLLSEVYIYIYIYIYIREEKEREGESKKRKLYSRFCFHSCVTFIRASYISWLLLSPTTCRGLLTWWIRPSPARPKGAGWLWDTWAPYPSRLFILSSSFFPRALWQSIFKSGPYYFFWQALPSFAQYPNSIPHPPFL